MSLLFDPPPSNIYIHNNLQTHKNGFSGKVASPPPISSNLFWKEDFEYNLPFHFSLPSLEDKQSWLHFAQGYSIRKPFRYFSSSARWTKLLYKITGISCINGCSWLSQLNDNETHVIFRVVPKAPKYKNVIHRDPKGQLWSFHIIYQKNCKLDKNLRIINFILHCSLGVLEGNYFAIF